MYKSPFEVRRGIQIGALLGLFYGILNSIFAWFFEGVFPYTLAFGFLGIVFISLISAFWVKLKGFWGFWVGFVVATIWGMIIINIFIRVMGTHNLR